MFKRCKAKKRSHFIKEFYCWKDARKYFYSFSIPGLSFSFFWLLNTDADSHAQWHTLTPTYRIGHVSCHMNLMTPPQTCWNSHQIREQQLSGAHALPHAVSLSFSRSLLRISQTHCLFSHKNTVCPWHRLYDFWQVGTVCVWGLCLRYPMQLKVGLNINI